MNLSSNNILSHSQFILKLKSLGFCVEIIGNNDRDYTFSLFVNGIAITNKDYEVFGYVCRGAYATCVRTNKDVFDINDIDVAINKCSEILMNKIISISEIPTFFDCKNYLKSFGKSKIDNDSITRVLSILTKNYQELIKSVVGFQHYR